MSILGLVCLLLGLIATLLLVLYGLQRREMRSVEQLSHQLQRIAIGGRLEGRVELHTDHPEIAALGTAINHLLTRSSGARLDRDDAAPELFAELADRIHEAVIVHRDVVLHANKQFAALVGVDQNELVGRALADIVPPEYAELVRENIRRRLKGETAAERYEIDMVGLQGQVSRLEIGSTLIEYEGESALLITGAEILPTQTVPQLAQLPSAADGTTVPRLHLQALDSLAEAVITTDVQGRIRYMNPAAQRMTGTTVEGTAERKLEDVVGLVDENDRRLLSDPLRQA